MTDDDDGMGDDEPESGIFRWMSAVVVLLAVAGFFGLAWYAYKNGGETVDDKDVELVKADKTPVKEAPANPGGMQIPNQDKTVYGLISGKNEKPVVERILPAPEEPIARSGDTETWMSDSVKHKGADESDAKAEDKSDESTASGQNTPDTQGDKTHVSKEQFNPSKVRDAQGKPPKEVALSPHVSIADATQDQDAEQADTASKPDASKADASKGETSKPDASKAETPKAASPKAAVKPPAAKNDKPADSGADADVDTKPALKPAAGVSKPVAKNVESPDADSDEDEKPAPKPKAVTKKQSKSDKESAAKSSSKSSSGARVQLGSYRSQSEAESNWKKISHKFGGELRSKQHYIVKASLGSKGTFYRLQVASFSSSKDAEQFCINFVSAGQGCILAKGK